MRRIAPAGGLAVRALSRRDRPWRQCFYGQAHTECVEKGLHAVQIGFGVSAKCHVQLIPAQSGLPRQRLDWTWLGRRSTPATAITRVVVVRLKKPAGPSNVFAILQFTYVRPRHAV